MVDRAFFWTDYFAECPAFLPQVEQCQSHGSSLDFNGGQAVHSCRIAKDFMKLIPCNFIWNRVFASCALLQVSQTSSTEIWEKAQGSWFQFGDLSCPEQGSEF